MWSTAAMPCRAVVHLLQWHNASHSLTPSILSCPPPKTNKRKLKANPLLRQLPSHFRISVQPIIHTSPLLLIEYHLQHLTPTLPRSRPLTHNFNRVHNITENGIVDGGKDAGMRALLGLRGARAVGTVGTGKDAAGGEEEDVTVGEFLFEFAG